MKRGVLESILGLAVLLLLGWALLAQAQATRETATAARVAAAGQTAASAGMVLLVGLLIGVVLVSGAVILILWRRLQRESERSRRRNDADGRWLAGPNAYWGRADDSTVTGNSPRAAGALDALVQMEVLRMLRELRQPARPHALPGDGNTEDDDGDIWETWY